MMDIAVVVMQRVSCLSDDGGKAGSGGCRFGRGMERGWELVGASTGKRRRWRRRTWLELVSLELVGQ